MDRDLLRTQLRRHEGLRLHPYQDTVGKMTIGYGRNLDDVGITRKEAGLLLEEDIDRVLERLEEVDDYNQLDPVRQAVIANMAFNLGHAGVMSFTRMWAAIRHGDWEEAAHEMLNSRWHEQVGERARELAEIMRFGEVES